MPITVVNKTRSRRGERDAKRHREKQKEAVKKQLPGIVSEEAIITRGKGRKVRVRIKRLEVPSFRPSKKKDGREFGVGQGQGKKGDVIGREPGQEKGDKAGQQEGEEIIETEMTIEEIIEMMLQDLGLPNIKEKDRRELEVILGFKLRGITTSGVRPLMDKRRTVKAGLKRFHSYVEYLKQASGRNETDCAYALEQSGGVLTEAEELLADPNFAAESEDFEPFPIFATGDIKYHKIVDDVQKESQAVVFIARDVSGSMHEHKAYLAKAVSFWLVEFLRKIYQTVEVRFIAHHTRAWLTDEDTFFRLAESGGTSCYTAFELGGDMIDAEYPTGQWNVYFIYFSDGEDFNSEETVLEIRKILDRGVNMVGYCELRVGWDGKAEDSTKSSTLLSAVRREFGLTHKIEENGLVVDQALGNNSLPLLCMVLNKKEHVYHALKQLLKKDRWGSQDEI